MQIGFRYRRVHISERTLQCLNGEFEVEPAFGEKREETLRIAGLKTYFIKKVLVPVSSTKILYLHQFILAFRKFFSQHNTLCIIKPGDDA